MNWMKIYILLFFLPLFSVLLAQEEEALGCCEARVEVYVVAGEREQRILEISGRLAREITAEHRRIAVSGSLDVPDLESSAHIWVFMVDEEEVIGFSTRYGLVDMEETYGDSAKLDRNIAFSEVLFSYLGQLYVRAIQQVYLALLDMNYLDKGQSNVLLGVESESPLLEPFEDEGKYGYCLEGEVVVEPQWDYAKRFYNGRARVFLNNKWGYIDCTGEVVLPCSWDYAENFYGEFAKVRQGEYFGIINLAGEIIVELKWDFVSTFREGLVRVETQAGSGYVNCLGELVIEPQWEKAGDFSEGLAKVKLGEKWGFIDRQGEVVIPLIWDEVWGFYQGVAKMKKGDQIGYIDTTGEIISWGEERPDAVEVEEE